MCNNEKFHQGKAVSHSHTLGIGWINLSFRREFPVIKRNAGK